MRKTDSRVRLSGPINSAWSYTIAETSAITGKCRSAVYDAIARGALDARKDGRRTRITGRSILEYQASLPRVESGGA
jgi:hypothetical protein